MTTAWTNHVESCQRLKSALPITAWQPILEKNVLFSTRQPKGISQNQCGHFTRSNGGSVSQKEHNWLIIIPQHVGAGGLICTIFILANSNDENLTGTVHLFMTATSGKICKERNKTQFIMLTFFSFSQPPYTTGIYTNEKRTAHKHTVHLEMKFVLIAIWEIRSHSLILTCWALFCSRCLWGFFLQHTCVVVKQDLICPEHQFSALSLFLGGLKQPH